METSDKKPTHARKPTQDRSRERVEKMIVAAEKLLVRNGPELTSIPEIAKLSGLPRSSVYQFFPSKYALFLAIADRHLRAVVEQISALESALVGTGLDEVVGVSVRAAADYYNASPVASTLILGGPMSRDAYLSQEITNHDIGLQIRALMRRLQPDVALPRKPDVMTIAVEIAFACLKFGYFNEARISDATVEQANIAVLAYLRHHAPFA